MIRPPGGTVKASCGGQRAAMIPSRVSDETISCDNGKLLT